jgi:hypothetical protein
VAAQLDLDRGVNQRNRQRPASPAGRRKAVSDRFISAATACIQAGSASASSRHTAAGLPANGSAVKASTWKSGASTVKYPNLRWYVAAVGGAQASRP